MRRDTVLGVWPRAEVQGGGHAAAAKHEMGRHAFLETDRPPGNASRAGLDRPTDSLRGVGAGAGRRRPEGLATEAANHPKRQHPDRQGRSGKCRQGLGEKPPVRNSERTGGTHRLRHRTQSATDHCNHLDFHVRC